MTTPPLPIIPSEDPDENTSADADRRASQGEQVTAADAGTASTDSAEADRQASMGDDTDN